MAMTLFRVKFKDWHEEYIRAHNSKEAIEIAKTYYDKSEPWYTVEM